MAKNKGACTTNKVKAIPKSNLEFPKQEILLKLFPHNNRLQNKRRNICIRVSTICVPLRVKYQLCNKGAVVQIPKQSEKKAKRIDLIPKFCDRTLHSVQLSRNFSVLICMPILLVSIRTALVLPKSIVKTKKRGVQTF